MPLAEDARGPVGYDPAPGLRERRFLSVPYSRGILGRHYEARALHYGFRLITPIHVYRGQTYIFAMYPKPVKPRSKQGTAVRES